MKAIYLMLIVISSNIFAADCVKLTNENLCMKTEWTQGPVLGAYSSNIVKFVDLDQSTADQEIYREPAYPVEFYGWMVMTNYEHGTRPVQTTVLAPGIYSNEKIFFMGGMQGTWQFNAKIEGAVYTLFEKQY